MQKKQQQKNSAAQDGKENKIFFKVIIYRVNNMPDTIL